MFYTVDILNVTIEYIIEICRLQYTIYNIGNVAAFEVEITDNSFHPDHFTHVSGELNARIDRVPPYANVSHTVVVRPRKFGYFNFTSAEVLYRRKEDAPRLQVAVSSEPGEGLIVAYRDYDKQFSSHVVSKKYKYLLNIITHVHIYIPHLMHKIIYIMSSMQFCVS